jgi:hypothetical protein
MSPDNRGEDMLTVGIENTQHTQYNQNTDDEGCYEWKDNLCILLESGRFISMDMEGTYVDVLLKKMDPIFGPKLESDKTFFKMRVGIKPGTMWCKIIDWEPEDYKMVLGNEYVMDRLENTITPDPTYINEMKREYNDTLSNFIKVAPKND